MTPSASASSKSKTEQKEYLWGYGTGITVARDPRYGEFVVAEETRTFEQHDSRYFISLIAQTEARDYSRAETFRRQCRL